MGWQDAPVVGAATDKPEAPKKAAWDDAPIVSAAPPAEDNQRWDFGGDLERSFTSATGALKEDVTNAFSIGRDKQARQEGVGAELGREAGKFGSALKIVPDALGVIGSPVTAGLHTVGGSLLSYLPGVNKKQADEGIDEAMMGAAPGRGLPSFAGVKAANEAERAATTAAGRVRKRFAEDEKAGGVSAADAMDKINKSDKPLALVDVGGQNVKGLAGNVSRQPGTGSAYARDTMAQRDAGAGGRLDQDIAAHVTSGPSMYQTTDELVKERSRLSRPLYEAMEKLQGIWSPRLQQFFADPTIQKGLARGVALERRDALAEGREFNPTQMGIDLDADGNVKLRAVPNMRVLDIAKQGLDAMISDERDPITGAFSTDGRSYNKLRLAYLGEIDKLDTSGTYAAARQAWGGKSAALDSMKAGNTIFQTKPEEVAAAFKGMSPANQEFYKLGVADILRERLQKTGFTGDEGKALINSNWMKMQLRPIFKSEAEFNKFVDSVSDESKMFHTRREVMGGTQTRARQVEDHATGLEDAAEGLHIAAGVTHNPVGTVLRTMRMARDIGLRPDPAVNDQMARMLFTPNLTKMSPMGQRIAGTYQAPRGPAVGGVTPPPSPPQPGPRMSLPNAVAPPLAAAVNPPVQEQAQ